MNVQIMAHSYVICLIFPLINRHRKTNLKAFQKRTLVRALSSQQLEQEPSCPQKALIMNAKSWLCCLILSSVSFLMVYTHMIIEERTVRNDSPSDSLQERTQSDAPPILIVELPKTVKKNKNPDTPEKNKLSGRSKRPLPPANCVPLWGSCKTPNAVCCEPCAFCQCRLFRTVCYCRMGNPRC
ncbi:agouti-signaling protein [Arapaima gigas]